MNFKILLSVVFSAASLVSAAQDANKTFAITGDGNLRCRNQTCCTKNYGE